MSPVLAMIQAANATEFDVVTLGPVTYKIRRVTSDELVNVGSSTLLAARPPSAHAQPADLRGAQRFSQAVVAAGVTALSGDKGVTWMPCTVVLDAKDEDGDAGKLWIEHLIPGHAKALYAAILKHSTDGGRAAEHVASFLGIAASDAAPRGE